MLRPLRLLTIPGTTALTLFLALMLAHWGIGQSVIWLMSTTRLLLAATTVVLLGLTPAAELLLRPRLRPVLRPFSLRRPRISLACLG